MNKPILKILFVCMGNICRSPTAEAVFRQKLVDNGFAQHALVDSAGTHNYHPGSPPDARSQAHAARAAWERAQHDGRGAHTWLNELIWRDFYFMILHHHPRVVEQAFRAEFDNVRFDDDTARYTAWCEGQTGYPLVDAAMRQLNTTGYMHNRLRMVTASFLVKDLHIDWRWGERYFARQLNDYDLAANNGGWQWAASTGCDSQPYFRIFNPVTQSEKFDAHGKFIRKYLPQLAACDNKFIHAPWRMDAAEQARAGIIIGRDYPAPIVDHAAARLVTLARYAAAK